MTRILADLPDEEIKRLDRIAYEQGKSRAAVLRDAVASYQAQPASIDGDWIERGFGLWSRHGISVDPQDYDRKRRAEWTRPWDDDYEEVRAESPDMFDAEDDRQRQIYLDMIAGKYPEPKSPHSK
ncbi:MAG: CopG family transcriptional regulator [Sphingopyxis sp.]|nr:ribbon-helix-helix domain-containing protein [Alphaproteobacteria bacterium]MBU0864141.1 ribbon-helix-helix domain-containing protein [Alphaproteobacteria bacterium]MBU1826810.1 ribbon-helix-helix domain-containing protein [Alphaproteobacteria bacterium]MDP3782207.1 CopG family transcriptional regulator [Sphingopyxis sp.]